MRKLLLISVIVLLVCQLGFAQVVNRNVTVNAIAAAKALGRPVPVMPASVAQGKVRSTVWVTGHSFAKIGKPSITTGEPSFCEGYGLGGYPFCPKGVQTAYSVSQILNANGGAGMVIAIVDFFAYPSAEANLAQFNADMGLPPCTTANGCFHSVVLTPYDGTGTGWDVESMLDLEYAHAMAPNAKIVYVQGDPYGANGSTYAENIAAFGCPASAYCSYYGVGPSPAGDIVSNSWTYTYGPDTGDDPYYNLGKPLLFASGDYSAFPYYEVESYPCTATTVTCIGGTSLYVNASLQRTSETGWSGSGGGCSGVEAIPAWQGHNGSGVCSPNRAAPDISAIADPNTGVAIFICNAYYCGYYGVGGTSLATPVTAGLVADINTARVSFAKPKFTFLNTGAYAAAYGNYPYFYYDITSGYNGYYAGPQFDLVTGLGNLTGKNAANRFFGLP